MLRGKRVAKVLGFAVGGVAVLAGGTALWAKQASNNRLSALYETHRVSFPVPFPLTDKELVLLRTAQAKKEPKPTVLADAPVSLKGSGPSRTEGPLIGEGDSDADTQPVDQTEDEDTETAEASDPSAVAMREGTHPNEDKEEQSDQPGDATTAEIGPETDPLKSIDLKAEARKRAVVRGQHLVEARYACTECHGADFGGGVMMDGMPVARLFGPNLTQGEGSVTKDYTVADWDRAVRHGVLPDGRPSAMPSEDYFAMSDQELSDIIAYIKSMPPVDRPSRPRELGPVGVMLMAMKEIKLSAEEHEDHDSAHTERPPKAAVTVEFGKHLINVCTGCHGTALNGGPIVGGDPNWPPAKNITPHQEGIAGWTYGDFVTAMREGVNKDGIPLRPPMIQMVPYAKEMTDMELEAMWKYLETVTPTPTGE